VAVVAEVMQRMVELVVLEAAAAVMAAPADQE
jgi:hypothetical protein